MQLKFIQLASLALAACSLAVSTTSAQTCTFDYKELECAPSKSCSLQYKFGDLSPAQACRAITTTVDANKVPQQSHLAFAGAVSGTGMTVSWTTRTKVTDPQVWIGTSQTSLSLASAVIETKSYYSDSSYSLFTYHATLSGLTPGSKYFYKVGSASSASFQSDAASFVTAKPAGSKDSFEVAIYGDFGVDANAAASNKFVNALNDKVDFVYHVGDISYADNAFLTVSEFVGFYYEETYNRWMSSLTALMRQVPYMVLVGNHEAECHSPSCLISSSKKDQLGNYTAFNARFKMPSAESKGVKNMWYSFDYASVHFTTISSETDYTDAPSNSYTLRKHGNFGNQLAWLEADLKKADANRANVPWLIVGMHRAMYTIRSQTNGVPNDEALPVQKAFEELFIKYKVDMVISGHVHAYERHLPIARSKAVLDGVSTDRKAYASPKAPVYVISGASGSSEGHNDYKGVTSPWNAKFDDKNYGVSQLKATSTALSWKFVASETGAVLDEFVISKRRHSLDLRALQSTVVSQPKVVVIPVPGSPVHSRSYPVMHQYSTGVALDLQTVAVSLPAFGRDEEIHFCSRRALIRSSKCGKMRPSRQPLKVAVAVTRYPWLAHAVGFCISAPRRDERRDKWIGQTWCTLFISAFPRPSIFRFYHTCERAASKSRGLVSQKGSSLEAAPHGQESTNLDPYARWCRWEGSRCSLTRFLTAFPLFLSLEDRLPAFKRDKKPNSSSSTGSLLSLVRERMTAIRSGAPRLWSRSRALWGGVLQLQLALVLVLISLALLMASSQGDEVSSLLRGPTSAHATSYGEAQFTSALVASHAGLQTHRRLASTTTNSTIDDATEKAKEIGASVRDAIKQLRGGSEKFYKDLITAAKIMICQHKVDNPGTGIDPSNRYVDETDDLAYKNSTGGCIRITITAMSDDDMVAKYANSNTCEVEPNCYWSTIDTAVDTDRVPVYATDRTVQPAEGSMTYSDAKDELKKWGQGMLVFVVPGIILAVLSLLTMIFFLICRCCCNRCGSRSPKEGGYTCMQKFLPLLFFLLFAVGVVAVAGVSLLYQKTLTDAVDDTFNTTLSTLNDTGAWLVRIRTPLEEIRDKVVDSADEIALQIADTSFIDNGIDGLTGALTKFKDDSADRTLPAGCKVTAGDPYCVACTVCTTISDQVGLANQQIKDNAGKGVAELKDVRDMLTTSLIKVKDTVRSSVADHVGDLDTFITMIADTHKNVDDVYGTYDGQKAAQQAGVLVFFGLALVVVVLGLLGILFGLTPLKFLANIIHIAYFIGFLALILTFIVSSIFLAVSVVLGDACEMTAIISQNWTAVVSGQNGDIVNACFDKNASLIDALNLTSQLDFARGGIPFPDNIDTNKLLDFSDLDAFAETIKGVDSSTFQVDQATLDKGLDALNKYTKQTDGQCNPADGNYVEATILTPWDANDGLHATTNDGLTYMVDRYKAFELSCLANGPGLPFECDSTTPCTFQAFVGELYKKASTLAAVKVDGAAFVTQLHQNMDAVTASTQTFKDKTKDLNDKVNVIKEDLEESLFSYVDDFEKEMTCTFIQDSYLGIYSALCGDLMPAFTMISLMLFLAGIFLIPVTICLIIAVKRLKARGNGSHVMDNEMKFK